MRVLIADPSSVEGVVAEDFTDQRLRQAFSALDLSAARPGEPVDISEAGGGGDAIVAALVGHGRTPAVVRP